MKYITFEKNEYDISLLQQYDYKPLTSFWIYDVYGLNCNISELHEDLQKTLVEIPEEVAKASCFSHINLSERKTINVKVEQQIFEWVKHALNIPKSKTLNPRDKFTYNITEEDEKNSVQFIKTILLQYLQKHFDSLSDGNKKRYSKKINGIKTAIEECQTNHDCHVIMHNHFNYPLLVVENKLGRSLPGAKWNLSRDNGVKTPFEHVTEESLDEGPTIDTISPSVFELKWEIGEPVIVKL